MFDLREFRDFCTARGAATFEYLDNVNCAVAQFLRHKHPEAAVEVFGHDYRLDRQEHKLAPVLCEGITPLIEALQSGSFHALSDELWTAFPDEEPEEYPDADLPFAQRIARDFRRREPS